MPKALIALGSNLGHRARYLHEAVQRIGDLGTVTDTSFLYETEPVLLEDQPRFLNAALQLETRLDPHELLQGLLQIEKDMGPSKTERYGPRIIDLDLSFYENSIRNDTPVLILPHYQATVRDFVLEPLCDMAPDFVNPATGRTLKTHWQELDRPPLHQVFPVGDHLWSLQGPPRIMGILNVSPESELAPGTVPEAGALQDQFQQDVQAMVAEGADAIDIGAQSTRPGHQLIPLTEEVRRLELAVQAAREVTDLPLSVDTFRTEAAQAALEAGADMVNDVWAGRFDSELIILTAKAGVPHVFLHNRLRISDPDYPARIRQQPRFVETTEAASQVNTDLQSCLASARKANQCRWLQVIDPGLGFGKQGEQNASLLRDLDLITAGKHPVMAGPSRKGFIQDCLSSPHADSLTAGSVTAAVLALQKGAHMVRMHDVRETRSALEVLANLGNAGNWGHLVDPSS